MRVEGGRVRGDVLSAALWVLVGLYFVYAGWDLGLGALHDPGSGFMIFWVGLAMAGLSAGVFVAGFRGAGERLRDLWAGTDIARNVRFVLALCVYAVLLPWLGFIPSTILLLIVLFRALQPQAWWVTAIWAVVPTAVCVVVFRHWFGIQLPAGVFGIG